MPSLVRYGFYWLAFLAISCGAEPHGERSSTATTSRTIEIDTESSVVSLASTATCPSRTINHITHTLAQQCLRSDWSRFHGATVKTSSSSTPVVNSTESTGQDNDGNVRLETQSTSQTTTSIPTSTQADDAVNSAGTETDASSPLDNANFLSFEDWRKQNLAKAGQSGHNLGARQQFEPGRRPADVNALDSLGEESEINLDFSGFGGASVRPGNLQSSSGNPSATTDSSNVEQVSPAAQALRPRDAGQTCKQRTNYASFDCAATVLKSNQECKSASSVLVENKDSYMLNKCSASNKYLIVELCNDILIDTVVLANYEFFSSIFRTFRVSVSDRYPAKAEKWKDLGTFEAKNTREVQAFLIENPLIWARYLRIEFLTHYGSEYYCPLSLLRVHGTTMMEEFRNQEELARGETQDDEAVVNVVDAASTVKTAVSSAQDRPRDRVDETHKDSAVKAEASAIYDVHRMSESALSTLLVKDLPTTSPIVQYITSAQSTCPTHLSSTAVQLPSSTSNTIESHTSSPLSSSTSGPLSSTAVLSESISVSAISVTTSLVPAPQTSQISSTPAADQTTASVVSDSSSLSHQKSPSTNSTKTATSTPPQAQPSTQESFFKSISKRLQQLESNSTLSLQYIEEQSRILRDAFSKVEKRQISTTTSFLSSLNKTVMAELTGFRQAYDQLWQSTVIELEVQREQHQREMTALGSRLTLVVDELVWQKRMGIVQSTLLLLCLGLVLFARQGSGTFEASLVQQVMARSQAAFRSGVGSDQNSPASGRSPVSVMRRRLPLWRKNEEEPTTEHSDDVSLSPSSPGGDNSLVESPILDAYNEDDDASSETSFDAAEHKKVQEEDRGSPTMA